MNFDPATGPSSADSGDSNPFTRLQREAQNYLGAIVAIHRIENADRAVRERWQNKQLGQLLRHAKARSSFWRRRMPARLADHAVLAFLPVQTRGELAGQTAQEGSLVAANGTSPIASYSSTG